jgi:hypothetical protein
MKKMMRNMLVGSLLLGSLSFNAQTEPVIVADDPIAALLDSLASQKMFDLAFTKPVVPKNNKFGYTADSVPRFDDYTYQSRLAKLDANSPFDLV